MKNENGSWFIECFVRTITENPTCHIHEGIVKTKNLMRKLINNDKEYKTQVPIIIDTIREKFHYI